jgi:quinol monooxygenase YgiN
MLVVLVHVRVKPGCEGAFEAATRENADASSKEAGVARFDLLRKRDEASGYLLVEAYRHADAPASHKETAHYAKWRDAVESLMAEPRQSVRYDSLFPEDRDF